MRFSSFSFRALVATTPLLLVFACNSTPNINVDGDRDGDQDSANGGADSDSDSDIGDEDLGDLGDIGNGGAGPIGNGKPEICDGVDNNADGFIDNIDAGGDGICDCLNIGTIGRIGPWSTGGDIFKTWLNERSPIPAREIADKTLTADELKGLDVIVVLRADTAALSQDSSPAHHAFSAAEVGALEDWVRGGGGLMTTIGYQSNETAEVKNVNKLLAAYGLGYLDPSQDVSGDIEDWVTHPISADITTVFTNNGSQPDPTNGTVVASQGDDIALVVGTPDDGRVVVFGDEWITYDSEWEDTEGQQVEHLWLNMIKWLSPPARCQVPIPPVVR